MAYETLRHIYYKSSDDYERIYKERYNSDMTTHVDFQIHDSSAFFVQTPAIASSLYKIALMDKEIYQLCEVLPGVAFTQYQRMCLIDEIVLTNNIEGVHSTRKEIDKIIDELPGSGRENRFRGLVQKYVKLISREPVSLETCQDIRRIYDDLVLEEIQDDKSRVPDGTLFRKESVSVYSPTGKELHRGIYPEQKIIEAVEKSISFLKVESIPLLLRAAVFHYLFGYIHPFYDGNGRTSRFISAYLISTNLEPLVAYRLSYTIKQRIQEYYKAFVECNDSINRGDITPFIEMFLDVVEDSIKQLRESLVEKINQKRDYIKMCTSLPNFHEKGIEPLYTVLVYAALFSEKGIQTAELIDVTEVSVTTLRERLNKIKKLGLLICKRFGHENFYMLDTNMLKKLNTLSVGPA